jgi:hypothetical protein
MQHLAVCVGAWLLQSGCFLAIRPPIERGVRVTNERFEVARLSRSQLSEEQRRMLDESGTPDVLVFETELVTGRPVQRWLYTKDRLMYVFVDGKKVDYVAVESKGKNPLLDPEAQEQGPLQLVWQGIQLLGHWLKR